MRLATLAFLFPYFARIAAAGKTICKHDLQFKKTKKVMGYYPSYSYKVQSPRQLNYELYTDVLFYVTVPELDYSFTYSHISTDIAERVATDFVKQARKHKVNTIMSFGGWTGSKNIANLTSSGQGRKKLARFFVAYADKFGFGGVDIAYPNAVGIGCNAHTPQEIINFGLLLKEVRALWPSAQITSAISIMGLIGADGKPATSLETAFIVQYLDFVNIIAFDVFGPRSETTGPLGPMHGQCAPPGYKQSVETGINALLKQGFPADHLVLGIPTYANRLQLVSPWLEATFYGGMPSYYYQKHTKITPPGGFTGDKAGLDLCSNQHKSSGNWLVNEIIAKGWLSKDQRSGGKGYVRHYDTCSGLPFLTDGKYFISYDDEFSTVAKAQYSEKKGLAGVFFFDTVGAPYTTIQAARQALQRSRF